MTVKELKQSYAELQQMLGATLNQEPFTLVRTENNGVVMLCNN